MLELRGGERSGYADKVKAEYGQVPQKDTRENS